MPKAQSVDHPQTQNSSETNQDTSKLTKSDFSEIEGVVTKRLRNKKKKLEKIISTENKINRKEITPTLEQEKMVASKAKVEGQIKELEEMRNTLRRECKKVLNKHNDIVKGLEKDEPQKDDTIINKSLGAVADALLVNLLQNEYGVKDLLENEEMIGLKALLMPLKSLFNPPADQIIYDRARDCFLEVFEAYVKGSKDIIPGSDTTYNSLLKSINNLPDSVKKQTHTLDQEKAKQEQAEALARAEESKKEVSVSGTAHDEPEWNQEGEDEDSPGVENIPVEGDEVVQESVNEPTIEELVENDVKKDMVKNPKTYLKKKSFVDEDGFVHVKPHARSEFEHNTLRGRGRRGKKGRHGETDRYKVRGGKGPRGFRGRGRGGKIHHDKHDVDHTGRKTKTAHGKKPHWNKGEVRTQQNLE